MEKVCGGGIQINHMVSWRRNTERDRQHRFVAFFICPLAMRKV